MRHFRVILLFNPTRTNMARKGLFGAWTVAQTFEVDRPMWITVSKSHERGHDLELAINALKDYRRGAVVSPIKIALDYLHAWQDEQARIAGKDIIHFGAQAHG